MILQQDVTAVVLAGGQGRRMDGADKGLLMLNDRPLVEHVIETVSSQVNTLVISANRNLAHYRRFGYPVAADIMRDFQGPLAGLLSAMALAKTAYTLTVPCDAPKPASDLVLRLATALEREGAEIAVAHDGKRLQPAHALVPVSLKGDLRDYLQEGHRKLGAWLKTHRLALADFSDNPSAFANINTQADLDRFALDNMDTT
jgi:molybdopterin-guanine dinucleotide biosynthesis protein A